METVPNPVVFFEELGGLHDAEIEWVSWEIDPPVLRLVVNNLNANFMNGLEPDPEYPGYEARQATLVFTDIEGFSGHMNPGYVPYGFELLVSDVTVNRASDRYKVKMIGRNNWVWMFDCSAVGLEPARQPDSVSRTYEQLKPQVD